MKYAIKKWLLSKPLVYCYPTFKRSETSDRVSANNVEMNPSSFLKLVESDQLFQLREITNEIVLPIIIILGIVLNTVGLVTVVSAKRRNDNSTYIYSLCLGSANLTAMILYIPFVLENVMREKCLPWGFVWYQAHMQLPLLNICLTFAVHILVWMSLERYVSVFQPTSFHRIHRKSIAKIGIVISVGVATLSQGPLAIYEKIIWYNAY